MRSTPLTSPLQPTVVVLHAHPDDEAIFTGITMRRLAEAGCRVVLVSATSGGAGRPRLRLARGESLRDRRIRELEEAAGILGVARLDVLAYADSGAHAGPYRSNTLGAAPASALAREVARVVEEEDAAALVHYDARGIYGHVDHVQVHRAGRLAARRGLAVYEATVDPEALRRGPRHVLQQAAGDDLDVGTAAAGIDLVVEADEHTLAAKRAAMAAHASQIGPEYLDEGSFAGAYSREWFVRSRGPAVLEGVLSGGVAPVVESAGTALAGTAAGWWR